MSSGFFMLSAIPLEVVIELALLAVAVAYVITGSTIGYPVRVVGYAVLHRLPIRVHTPFFCPPCCSWWCGAAVALWAGLPWQNIIGMAFTSCLLGVIVQHQWDIAANDEEEIAQIFRRDE